MNNQHDTVQFCRRCLYSSAHPLGLVIDDEGICSGCRTHEEKDSLDWVGRWQELVDLVSSYRLKSKNAYDCVVPVSGANDSYFIVHVVKNLLKLNPLLVNYNKYFNTPLGIRNLANMRSVFDCDILGQNVNPRSVKKIVRTTLREYGSVYWHCLAGQTVFPVQVAVRYKIPLIIWGANQGLEQVGMFSHEDTVQMTRRYRKDHDLFGIEADDLMSDFDVVNEEDIWQYRYPEDADIGMVGVTGIYLGNYVRWDPKAQHEQMIQQFGYGSATFPRTFDCYDHVDCYVYSGIHDLLKMYRHGYSKVTDQACREIRFGRLSRGQALKLVRHHEMQPPPYMKLFANWLDIPETALDYLLMRHRNGKYCGDRALGDDVLSGVRSLAAALEQSGEGDERIEHGMSFTVNSEFRHSSDVDRYVVIGKGYP